MEARQTKGVSTVHDTATRLDSVRRAAPDAGTGLVGVDGHGNPTVGKHWHEVTGLVVDHPAMFGGMTGPLRVFPQMPPYPLWRHDGTWWINPHRTVPRAATSTTDIATRMFRVHDSGVTDRLDPGRTYLLRHTSYDDGTCGVELLLHPYEETE